MTWMRTETSASMSSTCINPLSVYEVTIPSAHIRIRISAIVHSIACPPYSLSSPHRSSGGAAKHDLAAPAARIAGKVQGRSRRLLALHRASKLYESGSLNLADALLADAHVGRNQSKRLWLGLATSRKP